MPGGIPRSKEKLRGKIEAANSPEFVENSKTSSWEEFPFSQYVVLLCYAHKTSYKWGKSVLP